MPITVKDVHLCKLPSGQYEVRLGRVRVALISDVGEAQRFASSMARDHGGKVVEHGEIST